MRATAVALVALVSMIGCSDEPERVEVTEAEAPLDSGARLAFLYTEGQQVWGQLDTGERAAIDDVGRSPHLAADGRTILYTRGEWPDDETFVLDFATGERRDLDGFGRGGYFDVDAELGPGGRYAAARRSDAGPPQIDIVASPSFALERTITLGPEATYQGLHGAAWDIDGRHLLVFAWDTENEASWWWADTADGTVTLVDLPDDLNVTQHETFFLRPATAPGVFPVFLGAGWGELRVADGAARFVKVDPPGPPLHGIEVPGGIWLVDDGHLVATYDEYTEGSGRLVHVSPDGTTEVLVDGADWIDVA
jgi:hypothetical protein